MPSPLPRRNRWVRSSLASPAMSAFPVIQAGRLPHHPFRGLLSVYSRYGLHTRQVPCRTLYTEGFSRFVTSTTAPIATGWSDSCRVGIAPTERPCLCTAHRIVQARPCNAPADRRPSLNRVGGELTLAALPHHRTDRSVYGGSCLLNPRAQRAWFRASCRPSIVCEHLCRHRDFRPLQHSQQAHLRR